MRNPAEVREERERKWRESNRGRGGAPKGNRWEKENFQSESTGYGINSKYKTSYQFGKWVDID